MRVAHRNARDYGICGLLELLANFWQNGFFEAKVARALREDWSAQPKTPGVFPTIFEKLT